MQGDFDDKVVEKGKAEYKDTLQEINDKKEEGMENNEHGMDKEKFDIAKDAVGARCLEMERSVCFFGEYDFCSRGFNVLT